MNAKRITIAAAVTVTFCIIGCKKSTTSIDVAAPAMTATVDGTSFSVINPTQITASSSSSGGISYTYIYGTDSIGRVIEIAIANGYKVDSAIPLGTGSSNAYYYSHGLSGSYTRAARGSVTITSTIQPSIAGTFSFACVDSTNITNGSFVVSAP